MTGEPGGSLGLHAYRLLATAATPFLAIHLQSRVRTGREDCIRWVERWGFTEETRPNAPLIWFHAVSVGECAVALPILSRCLKEWPQLNVLFTHGTTTAASFLHKHGLPRTITQYAPFDTPAAVERFMAKWKPQAGIIVESELWPNLIFAAHNHQVPLALVNANISPCSTARWSS
eukprot:CAMPEP_0118938768 /NCGR_PEP_ID=MMETSP1169-20130426/27002_1 /TAXON_ID=36882 /ORGANISM="Pyramimonas obovata, Strain CCMP722" /LENGTH=174 /DNA_ID=CAMNT_0006882821 /DNA_START=152 /DNA_END=672 /DNA_ORIENTATION=+